MYVSENIGLALMLTTIAGLSTGIGGAIACFIKKPKMVYLAFLLGLSAGVMIYLSFMELLPDAINGIGKMWAVGAFFMVVLFIHILDRLTPDAENPHHVYEHSDIISIHKGRALMRTGLFTALAIGIHNFP